MAPFDDPTLSNNADRVSAIRKRRKLMFGCGMFGLAVAVIFWVYSAYQDYSQPMNGSHFGLTALLVVLCPPSVLSIPFGETEPDSIRGIVIWFVIGLINYAVYTGIGAILSKYIWKPD